MKAECFSMVAMGLISIAGTAFADHAGNAIGPDVSVAAKPLETSGIRAALLAIADTEYCGTAVAEGFGTATAMAGMSPVKDIGFVNLDGQDWVPVALELAGETLGECLDLQTAGAGQNGSEKMGRLRRLLNMIGNSEGHREQVSAFLERFAKQPIREAPCGESDGFALDWVPSFWIYWFRQSDLETVEGAEQCMALERWLEEFRSVDSPAVCRFRKALLEMGLARCKNIDAYAVMARCALRIAERTRNLDNCRMFDKQAVSSGLAGWVGSIQRRRLAERFPDEPVPRFQQWDEKKRELVDGDVIESMLPLMLTRRAAAELAADESELTDLREVYGDWNGDGGDKN